MKSVAVVFPAAGQTEVREVETREPGAGEILIKAAFSTLSPGTERNLLMGKSKQTFPISVGYSLAGHVVGIGPGVGGFQEGQPVVTTGSHASHVVADARFVTPVPAEVDMESAAFFVLGHTAIYGVRQAQVELGIPVIVLGQGPVGILTARLAQMAGAVPVIAVDLDERKLDVSRTMGIPVTLNAADRETILSRATALPGGGAGAVIDATGAREPVELALDLVRPRGRVVLLSSPTFYEPIDCYRRLSMKGASLVGGYVNSKPWTLQQTNVDISNWPPRLLPGSMPYAGPGGWTSDEDVRLFLDLLRYRQLDLKPLITHRFGIEQAAQAYDLVKTKDPSLIGGLFRW